MPKLSLTYSLYIAVAALFLGIAIGPLVAPPALGAMDDHSDHFTHDHSGGHDQLEVDQSLPIPAVTIEMLPDGSAGWNLLVEVENFEFTPRNVNGEPVSNEGHAHIYIDGEKLTRLYANAYYISELSPGEHEIMVTLNANDHSEYALDGETIQASVTIEQMAH